MLGSPAFWRRYPTARWIARLRVFADNVWPRQASTRSSLSLPGDTKNGLTAKIEKQNGFDATWSGYYARAMMRHLTKKLCAMRVWNPTTIPAEKSPIVSPSVTSALNAAATLRTQSSAKDEMRFERVGLVVVVSAKS